MLVGLLTFVSAMANLISVKNVSKRFSTHTALDQVSLDIPEGSIFGLLGPNGAGKTTLIRIINQITGPDSGQVLFEDRLLERQHVEQIGYLPEERGLYKKMRVGEQALYLAQLKGLSKQEAKRRLHEWFERFEMGGWWKKKVEELSKGMQQKVQFIVTVLHEPRLLILDEPFSGFDPINAQLIKDELLRLRKNGATIMLSTHNMGSVEELCDNIALIDKSQKILDGSVAEIKRSHFTGTYDLSFKGTLIGFTNAMWTGGELVESKEENGRCHVRVRLRDNVTPNHLLQAVIPHVEVYAFTEVLPTMNDIFIATVQRKEVGTVLGTQSHFTE